MRDETNRSKFAAFYPVFPTFTPPDSYFRIPDALRFFGMTTPFSTSSSRRSCFRSSSGERHEAHDLGLFLEQIEVVTFGFDPHRTDDRLAQRLVVVR